MKLCSLVRACRAFACVALLAACESGTGGSGPPRLALQASTQVLNFIGDTVLVRATATSASGAAVPTTGVQWTSSNAQVATVSGGFVTARAPGTTTITATLEGVEAALQLEVRQVPAALRMTAPTSPLGIGQTRQISATLVDSAGVLIPGGTFGWSSSHPQIASVTPQGVASGVGTGKAMIRASSGGLADSALLRVEFMGQDTQAPDIRNFSLSFSPAAISAAGADSVAVLTVSGTDEGNGIVLVTVSVGSNAPLVTCTIDNPSTGNGQNGTWSCPVRRGQLAGPGTYRVVDLMVGDGKGNAFTAHAQYLEALGKQAYLTVGP